MSRLTALLLVFALLAAPAMSQTKEESYQELIDLGSEINAAKGSQNVDALIADYVALSASFGGDDPGGILGSGHGKALALKAAPAAPPGGTSSTSSFSNNTPMAIVDNTTITSDIVVAGVDTYLYDVDLTTNITHTFGADLDMTLTSAEGTIVVVSTDNGGGDDDVFNGTLWDDFANDPSTDHTYANLTTATPLTIEEALAALVGENPNGTWTLTIADDAGGDTGSLDSWSLDVTTLDNLPIETGPNNFSNNTPVAIVDNTTVTSDISVGGLDAFICDLNLTTNITHTFGADLDITLTSAEGTIGVVTTDNGGGDDDVFNGTLWDDFAGDPATDHTYTNLTTATPLTVEEALGLYIGEDPNGTWTLTIADDAGGDTGSLDSWSLDVITCLGEPPPPPIIEVPTLGGLGMALLASLLGCGALLTLWRRRRS